MTSIHVRNAIMSESLVRKGYPILSFIDPDNIATQLLSHKYDYNTFRLRLNMHTEFIEEDDDDAFEEFLVKF